MLCPYKWSLIQMVEECLGCKRYLRHDLFSFFPSCHQKWYRKFDCSQPCMFSCTDHLLDFLIRMAQIGIGRLFRQRKHVRTTFSEILWFIQAFLTLMLESKSIDRIIQIIVSMKSSSWSGRCLLFWISSCLFAGFSVCKKSTVIPNVLELGPLLSWILN